MIFFVGQTSGMCAIFIKCELISQAANKTFSGLTVVECGNLKKCFTNIHSVTISYLSEGHTSVIVSRAKRALSF